MSVLTQIVNNHFHSPGTARTMPLPHKNTTAFYFLATDIETEHEYIILWVLYLLKWKAREQIRTKHVKQKYIKRKEVATLSNNGVGQIVCLPIMWKHPVAACCITIHNTNTHFAQKPATSHFLLIMTNNNLRHVHQINSIDFEDVRLNAFSQTL